MKVGALSSRGKNLKTFSSDIYIYIVYTGAPVVGTPILGTHYIVSCDTEVCGAERESSRTI